MAGKIPTIKDLLRFWFGRLESDGFYPMDKSKVWFNYESDSVRKDLLEKFGYLMQLAENGSLDRWKDIQPSGGLALILLYDQIPRHIYKGTAKAYAFDEKAQELALWGVRRGMDKSLYTLERTFYYQPLMHSEDFEVQKISLECYEDLVKNAHPSIRLKMDNLYNEAVLYYKWVEYFGRVPQRNEALGRESTPDELEFLGRLMRGEA